MISRTCRAGQSASRRGALAAGALHRLAGSGVEDAVAARSAMPMAHRMVRFVCGAGIAVAIRLLGRSVSQSPAPRPRRGQRGMLGRALEVKLPVSLLRSCASFRMTLMRRLSRSPYIPQNGEKRAAGQPSRCRRGWQSGQSCGSWAAERGQHAGQRVDVNSWASCACPRRALKLSSEGGRTAHLGSACGLAQQKQLWVRHWHARGVLLQQMRQFRSQVVHVREQQIAIRRQAVAARRSAAKPSTLRRILSGGTGCRGR